LSKSVYSTTFLYYDLSINESLYRRFRSLSDSGSATTVAGSTIMGTPRWISHAGVKRQHTYATDEASYTPLHFRNPVQCPSRCFQAKLHLRMLTLMDYNSFSKQRWKILFKIAGLRIQRNGALLMQFWTD
jgi:hypothetical protein